MRTPRLVALLTAASIALVPPAAHASGEQEVAYLFLGIVVAPFVNLVGVAEHERPDTIWLVAGYITGTLFSLLGAFCLDAATPDNDLVKPGVGLLVWGSFSLGTAIWASTLPRAADQS